ncbi:hypothetical protein KGD83_02840 [Nocardiopsis akebiae]|uniref:Uncharacterized protein n=1 Tax=Nocardiopsis akebiae TaxID=2831968 RepID=A0ABX8C547_9ACTN|nr:hypothetical protein [Nocardiopsis akebiae]QUX29536.1 hypothetical protein KGD83_02840 [Nocardiopsis akebiae]
MRSKLNVTDIWYVTKIMESSPGNWEKIANILENPNLVGVVGKFGRGVYARMGSEEYSSASSRMIENLSKVPHMIFIHEEVINGGGTKNYDVLLPKMHARGKPFKTKLDNYLSQLPEETTATANNLLNKHGIQVSSYTKNSELYVLADSFIEDLENNLLFRIYVPKGKLYSNEMSRLLDLFREWLTTVKKEKIRQDGYKTSRGQVFEFFSERDLRKEDMAGEIQEFSRFLDLCSYPDQATLALQGIGIERTSANELVGRYAKEVRRLRIDIKQEREKRILQIRHQMESEVTEGTLLPGVHWAAVGDLVASMVPESPGDLTGLMTRHEVSKENGNHPIQINQQFIERAYGEVSQNIAGTQHFGPDAQALIELIRDHGGEEEADLVASVHEASDEEARTPDRLAAKNKIKSFLIRSRDNIEATAFSLAQSYIESQMGL